MPDSPCRLPGGGGEEMVTGGISKELSWGGGCCHWGSGPASRSVWSSGPASITAFKNFPFSGNGFSGTNSPASWGGCSCAGGGGDGNDGGGIGLFSVESEVESPLLDPPPFSSPGAESDFPSSSCWSTVFSNSSTRHFPWNSFLSLIVIVKRSLRWNNSSSFLAISSWAERIVVSSSKVVYNRECFSSSIPCQIQRKKEKLTSPKKEKSNPSGVERKGNLMWWQISYLF